jgi:UDP-glucose 4-epimerase
VGREGLKTEYSGDNSRIKKEMGGFEFTPMRTSLEMLIEYYQKRLNSIDCNLLRSDKQL